MGKSFGWGLAPVSSYKGGLSEGLSGLSLLARAACAAALVSCLAAGSAFAAAVHGADYHGTGSAIESGEVDVLDVDGSAGEKVFLTVKAHGQAIAQNLPYTIGENESADDGATWAGIATLDIDGLDLNALDGTYVIEAYASRAGGDPLYSGALYGVYADLPDGTSKLIGTRTANKSELTARPFEPAETLYAGGHTYRLSGDAQPSGEGVQHFAYEEYDEATTVDGVVKYVDAAGETVATTKIPGLAYGEERRVDIPSVVTADDGSLYRTVFFKSSVTAANPGSTSFSVYCVKMSEADQALAGFYVATIQMVDENGRVIATDSVNVTGEFTYTAPSTIYKTETNAKGESEVVTYLIDGSSTIRLSAANDNVLTRARTVKVAYTAQPSEATQVDVTFNLLDGSKRVNEEGRSLGSRHETATEAAQTVEPPSSVEVGGVSYRLVGAPADYAYTLHSGAVPSVDAYYVPEGYQAPGAYDVTVNYVNFLTGAVVESHTYSCDPDQNSRITIDSPETFSANGVDYVKLAGQESAIAHSYYSGISTYSVYYRDVNDELSSETVINTIRVVYVDEPGTATTVATTDEEVAAADAQNLQLNDGRTYNVFDGGDNNATLTNESGIDSNTERIEDSETPLASGFDRGGTSSAASSIMQVPEWLPPVGIGAAVIVVGLIVFAGVRRRKNDEMNEW